MGRTRLASADHGAISITPLPDGRFRAGAYVREPGEDRRRLTATGTTEAEARKALEARLAMRAAGYSATLNRETTVAALGEAYLETLQGVGANTVKAYARSLEREIKPSIGSTAVAELKAEDVEAFLGALVEVRPAAAKVARVVLRAMMTLAVEVGVANRVPVGPETQPRLPAAKEVRLMTRVELARMRRLITAWQNEETIGAPRTKNLEGQTMLFIVPGVRSAAEALGASWEDINLETGIWRINSKRARTVRLYPAALEMLRERHEALGRPSEGLVFPSASGRPVANSNFFRGIDVATGGEFTWITAGCMISH